MKITVSHLVGFFLVLIVCAIKVQAQTETKLELEKCVRLEGGFIAGSQIVNDNFLYNPGGSFKYTYGLKSGKRSGFGIGGGVEVFEKEAFIPFYFDFIGFLGKSKSSGFVNLQAGYAFGWSDKYKNFPDYEYKGGIYFGVGIGKRFQVNEKFSTYLSCSYRHQFASISYNDVSGREYVDLLNYDMLVISLGIMLVQK